MRQKEFNILFDGHRTVDFYGINYLSYRPFWYIVHFFQDRDLPYTKEALKLIFPTDSPILIAKQ